MFCTNCGVKGAGNFCAACGMRLAATGEINPVHVEPVVDWSHEIRYEVLLQIPAIRERLAKAASLAPKKMSAEDWLGLYDKAFKPMTGLSMKTMAAIVAPLYVKMGIKTGKNRSERLSAPTGKVIVDVLCAMAESGLPLIAAHQGDVGCVIEAKLPSDLWSLEGQLVATVETVGTGTRVEIATNIPGQWFDWGKSTRCLDKLFNCLRANAA